VAWLVVILGLLAHDAVRFSAGLTPDLNDFGRFWASTHAVVEGRSAYVTPAANRFVRHRAPTVDRNLNPPHLVWLLAPLGYLPARPALFAWTALGLLALLFITRRTLRAAPLLERQRVIAFVLALSATGVTLQTGQISFLLAWPMALSWLAMREGREARAGAYLGLCAAAKPFLLVFVLGWLLGRRWRAAASAVGSGLAWVLAGLLVAGWTPYREWLDSLARVYWFSHFLNMSVVGFTSRAFADGSVFSIPVYNSPVLTATARWALTVLLTAFGAWWVRREADVDRQYLGLGVIGLLLSPLGWVYYLLLVTGPLAIAMFPWLRRDNARTAAIVALVLLCIPNTWLARLPLHPLVGLSLRSAYFWGGCLLLWNLGRDASAPERIRAQRYR
jgi:alpha-1,2-mannosyltransferase